MGSLARPLTNLRYSCLSSSAISVRTSQNHSITSAGLFCSTKVTAYYNNTYAFLIRVLPQDTHIDDVLTHGTNFSITPAQELTSRLVHYVVDSAQEVLHLDRGFRQNALRRQVDVLFQVVPGDCARNTAWAEICLAVAEIKREALVFDAVGEVALGLFSLRLLPHVFKHLVHEFVRRLEVFVEVERHADNGLPDNRVQGHVPSLARSNCEANN